MGLPVNNLRARALSAAVGSVISLIRDFTTNHTAADIYPIKN
jgi:hypothetical protein